MTIITLIVRYRIDEVDYGLFVPDSGVFEDCRLGLGINELSVDCFSSL